MRKLLQQALDALETSVDAVEYEYQHYVEMFGKYTTRAAQIKRLSDDLGKHKAVIEALKAELAKPEPEPVAYMLTTRNFGLGGETWDTTEYRDYQWDSDCVPLYTKGTPNV